jgi:diguanylate cyclase (GGDEF)-like protein
MGIAIAGLAAPWWAPTILAVGLIVALVPRLLNRKARRVPSASPSHQTQSPGADSRFVVLRSDARGALTFVDPDSAKSLGWQSTRPSSLALAGFVHGDDIDRMAYALDAIEGVARARVQVEVRVGTPDGWCWTGIQLTNGCEDAVGGYVLHASPGVRSGSGFYGAQHDREQQLAAISQTAQLALDTSDDVSVAYRTALAVAQTLSVDSCEVYRRDQDRIELIAGVQSGRSVDRHVLEPDQNPFVEAGCASETPLGKSQDRPHGIALDSCPGPLVGLTVPLVGSMSGVVVVGSLSPRTFSEGDLSFVESMAAVISLGEQRRDAEADALRSAHRDVLTGLINRTVFLERLRAELMRSQRQQTEVAVMLIGLDNFKVVNDSLGHAAGDTLLEACGNRLSAMLRPGDSVARFGGDEFVVLAKGLSSAAQAHTAAERLRSSVETPTRAAGQLVRVTGSVGLAVAEGDVSAEVLIQQADAALHHAKARGRERVEAFDPTLLHDVVTRLRTETELREALADGQLRVFYQPIVDLTSGRMVSAEALVRWLRPGHGLVTPSEFIPISEATGLIEEIGSWVIGEAVGQAAAWKSEGRPIRVSVNLAQRQIADPELLKIIDRALDEHHLSPELFAVEVTESTVMEDRSNAFETLRRLAERGIGIAIDDFGTGYSSMGYLQKLPVDLVKIDRSFISGIDRSKSDFAITSALIQVCRSLGKTVVAEGVETQGQLELLRELHCDQAQGFLFSPAVIELQPPLAQDSSRPVILDRR